MTDFSELVQIHDLFQYMRPLVTYKGQTELKEKNRNFSDGYYVFMQDLLNGDNIFEITLKNNWSLCDSAKIFLKLLEEGYLFVDNFLANRNVALAMFMAGKIKTGEFLIKIKRINDAQLQQALKYQKQLNSEGRHVKMASVLIKLGFVSDKGLDSLLLLKEESKKRLTTNVGLTSIKYNTDDARSDQIYRLQRELSRLENENNAMKKRLKKLLNL